VLRRPVTTAVEDPWVRWDWVADHRDDITQRLGEHLELVGIALLVGLAIAVPLGVAVWRWRRLYPPVLAVMGVVYSIPSLALLAFLIPWTGLTTTTSEIMLVGFTLLILVRNTVAGLDSVPDDVQETARGMGYSANRQLLRIELPLALPAIIAGVRITAVTTVGLATITALIGQGGLGAFILDGLRRDFRTPLVVGTVLTVLLAVVLDVGLAGLQRLLTPWNRRRA
jgi:osmoprotectant transport system permease protein